MLVMKISPYPGIQACFQKANKPLHNLITGLEAALPKWDDGAAFLCLSHALCGNCNSLCHRKETHWDLTLTEVNHVGAFLTQASCK